jgi:hypothetical protein
LLRALKVASPILDLKRGSSSLFSGCLICLLSYDNVASPICFKSFERAVFESFKGLRSNACWLLLLDDAIKTALSSSFSSFYELGSRLIGFC